MVIRIFPVIFLVLWLFGCSTSVKDTDIQNRVNHVVLCWLKEPGNIDHRRVIIEASRSFNNIPGVLDISAGRAIQSDRDIADDSFDVGIYFAFRTPEDMKRYIIHPTHRETVENLLLPIVDRIIVYDFIESRE